jgi:hypothetical protein
VDTAPRQEPEAQNRRSTRIVQAVPLTVTGVDALGRPFQERTSTLIINCQGCRYQSKHYVLKNMWLTFEVPHPETGRPPRSVRARVTWVQRPRTIRELFQVGAELEVVGNLWGVAFPPADWTQFPDAPLAEIPAPSTATAEDSIGSVTSEADAASPVAGSPSNIEIPEDSGDNVRVMRSPGAADDSILLARQISRLVNEAKQQLQETAHTQAAQAVSAEIRSLLFSIENQLHDAAEKSVREAASTHGEEILRAALENISQGEIERLSARWAQEAERHLRSGLGRFSVELDQFERRRRDELESHLGTRFDQVRAEMEDATRALEAESTAAHARVEQWRRDAEETSAANLRRWTELAESTTAHAQSKMTELEAAAARVAERVAAATTEAEAGWRGRLEADVASANSRVDQRVESSLEAAARSAADRLARNSESSAVELERNIAQRIETLGNAFTEATAEAESALGTIRAAIGKETGRAQAAVSQLHEAAAQVEDHRAILDGLRRSSSDELEHRSEALLESHSAELNRRAEAIANSVVERLEPGLMAAGRQLLSTLALEIQEKLAPQIDRAGAALRELEAGTARTEEALHAHEERLREMSERSLKDTSGRADETFRRYDAQLQEAGAAAQARWLAELETKANDTTHEAFESIFKSAEWYEKKVQTQMQATLEKGLAQAAEALRAKAGEISGQFATELDHYTRSYVEHAKEQLDEQAQAAATRTREAAQAASDAVAGGFSERAAKIAAEQYQRMLADSSAAEDQFAARLEAQRADVQSKIDSTTRETATRYQAEIAEVSAESLAAARQKLDAQAETMTETWRAARAAEVQQVELGLARLGNQAVEDYKQRLENTSNTWVLASVTKLNSHSQNLIEQLATASEDRIRAACSGIFAEIGESLRQRMAQAPDAEPRAESRPAPESGNPSSNG